MLLPTGKGTSIRLSGAAGAKSRGLRLGIGVVGLAEGVTANKSASTSAGLGVGFTAGGLATWGVGLALGEGLARASGRA